MRVNVKLYASRVSADVIRTQEEVIRSRAALIQCDCHPPKKSDIEHTRSTQTAGRRQRPGPGDVSRAGDVDGARDFWGAGVQEGGSMDSLHISESLALPSPGSQASSLQSC